MAKGEKMIEVSTDYIDGVSRIKHIGLVPPFEYKHGVQVELVSASLVQEGSILSMLATLGFQKVGYAEARRAVIYARKPFGIWQYKVVNRSLVLYWALEWFAYTHLRMFQSIPVGELFSWRYWTPYYCCRYLWGRIVQWLTHLLKRLKH